MNPPNIADLLNRNAELENERDQATYERNMLLQERNMLLQERNMLLHQINWLLNQRNHLLIERNELIYKNMMLATVIDKLYMHITAMDHHLIALAQGAPPQNAPPQAVNGGMAAAINGFADDAAAGIANGENVENGEEQ